ncbi:MAG: flagellar protein FlaG [Desulfonatronovibrio sp.]
MNITQISPSINTDTTISLPRETDLPREKILTEKHVEKLKSARNISGLDQEKLESAVNSIKEYMNSRGLKLEFQIHQKSDQIQVTVINPENEKIVRKIPADEILELAESIEEMLGLLLNKNL